jgi:hypothetical protein
VKDGRVSVVVYSVVVHCQLRFRLSTCEFLDGKQFSLNYFFCVPVDYSL